MSNKDPRTPEDGRWSNEPYTESMLAESGRRALSLNETRRAAVLRVLLAEAARLKELSLRAARKPVGWLRLVATVFTPRVALGVSMFAALALLVATYGLFGGARIPSGATLNGSAAISERRFGPFGLQWNIGRPSEVMADYGLHRGDGIVANGPVTITYADGSQVVAAAGSSLAVLADQDGVALANGEIASTIAKSSAGDIKFRVETPVGLISVKGTEFRVQSGNSGVMEFTDLGRVTVANNVASVDVSTGEQVQLTAGVKPVADLQAPRVTFETRATGSVISNKLRVPFVADIYPGATLVVVDAESKREIAHYLADATGRVKNALPEITTAATLQFRQAAVSPSKRTSGLSDVVNVQIDRVPPTLAITRVQRDGDVIRLTGRTEVKSEVRVDGKRVEVSSDGTFNAELTMKSDMTTVEITAIDLAGNTTTMMQSLK